MNPFKILFMYPTVGGGSLVTAQNVQEALKEIGASLKVIDPWEYRSLIQKRFSDKDEGEINRLTKEISNGYLIKAIEGFKPDLFLTVFGLHIEPEIFQLLKKEGIVSCCWFLDDPWGFEEASRIAPNYDFFFTHEPTTVEKYKAIGVKNAYYLPEACNSNMHRRVDLTEEEKARYSCDLSFVGRPHSNRIGFLERLADYDLGIWGDGWDDIDLSPRLKGCIKGGEVPQQEMVKIFNVSKIALNLHPTSGLKGMEAGEGICPRTFAIAGSGAFQLVDWRGEMERLFRVGEEIITFRDIDEVPGLVDYYLNHPDERRTMAKRVQERVYKEHTYKRRIEEMLKFIGEYNGAV